MLTLRQLGHLQLGVGKETEYETSAMSGGWPTRREGPRPNFAARDYAASFTWIFENTSFQAA
jgi:hypothetical protein